MAKTLPDILENPMVMYREPSTNILGRCPCGCGEVLQAGYEAISWDDKVFYDEFHLVKYLERTDGLKRVS